MIVFIWRLAEWVAVIGGVTGIATLEIRLRFRERRREGEIANTISAAATRVLQDRVVAASARDARTFLSQEDEAFLRKNGWIPPFTASPNRALTETGDTP